MQPEPSPAAEPVTPVVVAAPTADAPALDPVQQVFANFKFDAGAPATSGEGQPGAPAQGTTLPAADAAPSPAQPVTPAAGAAAADAAPASAAAAPAVVVAPPVNPFAELGEGYQDLASVQAALAELGLLRANQLTDEHRQAHALTSDPEKLARYAELTRADYSKLPDKEVLFEKYKQDNPKMPPRALKKEFETAYDTRYKALAYEDETDDDYLTAKELIEHDVREARTALDTARTTELAALKPEIKPAEPDAAEVAAQANIAKHVEWVEHVVKDHKGVGFAIEGAAEPFIVTATDPAAFKEALVNPARYIMQQVATPEGGINEAELQKIALVLAERNNLVNLGVKQARNLGAATPLREQAHIIPDPSTAAQPGGDEEWKKQFVQQANAPQSR